MIDPTRELKIRAELLHHAVAARRPTDLARLRVLPELRRVSHDELAASASRIQRKHCLAAVARELGFEGWAHAVRVLRGDEPAHEQDYGAVLYPRGCSVHLNAWLSTYDEARQLREERGGYLLAYRRNPFVVESAFIRTLGLEPDDPDWAAIGWDMIRPRCAEARRRIYAKLLARAKEAA